jgi:hypothetical protein
MSGVGRVKLLDRSVVSGTYVTDPLSLGRIPDAAEYLSVQAKFVGGPDVASAFTLVNDVPSGGASAVDVIITDTTPSITSGYVRIAGLTPTNDQTDTVEVIDISGGADTYTTVTEFTEIHSVYAWGMAILGGTGDEKIEVQWNSDSAVIVAQVNLVEPTADFNIFVQTTLDEGTTWCDVMNYHFTTYDEVKIHAVKLNTALAANVTPTDGAMGANLILSGLIGNKIRLKYTTTDEYVGASVVVDVAVR